MTTVYIDRVFALNSLADYLLLLTAARLAGSPLRRLRFSIAAALGGAYAVAAFLPGCLFLSAPLCKTLAGVGIALLAFWPQRRRFRLTSLFLLLSGALAGLLLAVGLASEKPADYLSGLFRAEITWPVFVLACVVFYLLLFALFRRSVRHEGGDILRVIVRIGETDRNIMALHDTGNTLCDPVNGDPVLVLEQDAIRDLWPPEVRGVLERPLPPEEKMSQLHRLKLGRAFTLIPFRSVGVASGLLLAFRSERITVENRVYRRALVALSESRLSDGSSFQALWGGEEGSIYGKDPIGDPHTDSMLDHAV